MTRGRGPTILDRVASPRLGTALVIGLALQVATAHAEPDAESKARGAKLFEAARVFAKEGEFARACELFEQSYVLDPGAGTEMNLADCSEHLGQLAKAWHLFDAAAAQLDHDGDSRAAYAHQRADKLIGGLVTVIVHVAPPLPVGLVVMIDHRAVAVAEEIHEVVEPGMVEVSAAAPGRVPLAVQRTGSANGNVTFELQLEPIPEVTTPPPPRPPISQPAAIPIATAPSALAPRRKAWVYAAFGMGGVGALAEVVAVLAGASARSEHATALSDGSCRQTASGLACTPAGALAENSAGSTADAATEVAIAGGVLLIGGAIVYAVAPRGREQLRITPMAGTHVVGLALGRAF